jgi:hypothetical protein
MPVPVPDTRSAPGFDTLAETVFDALARQFPVCTASDEFHFFPQVQVDDRDWTRWDDFSAAAISAAIAEMTVWEERLVPIVDEPRVSGAAPLSEVVIDAAMLLRLIRTLRSQLAQVRPHETQPSFYLTIAGIGLAEALEAGPAAFQARLTHLPAFLEQASLNLKRIPRLFRDLGSEMLARQREWLASLDLPPAARVPVEQAYRRLTVQLEQARVRESFLPPVDLYGEIARDHMGSGLGPEEISTRLAAEIAETRGLLSRAAGALAPGRPWQAVVQDLPRPPTRPEDPGGVYRDTIAQLATHCGQRGLTTAVLVAQCPVLVKEIPAYMGPVRSSAAYSMPPGHPPRGGTFFIEHGNHTQCQRLPPDYRLLTAHETYPGHHLLDTSRWRHERPVRRQIEFPTFYEGWASFSEELLFDTGFFAGPVDELLMAKRRFWRALRGLTDFDIHMRRKNIDEAAARLAAEGLPGKRAESMVKRYCLKPGYQLAYTLGRRRFRRLYAAWRRHSHDATRFARRVLAQGQIDFQHLEHLLLKGA